MAECSQTNVLDKRHSTTSNKYVPVVVQHSNPAFQDEEENLKKCFEIDEIEKKKEITNRQRNHEYDVVARDETALDGNSGKGFQGRIINNHTPSPKGAAIYDQVANDEATFHGFPAKVLPGRRVNNDAVANQNLSQHMPTRKNRMDFHGESGAKGSNSTRHWLYFCIGLVILALVAIVGFIAYLYIPSLFENMNNDDLKEHYPIGGLTTPMLPHTRTSSQDTPVTIRNCDDVTVTSNTELGTTVTWTEPAITDAGGTVFEVTESTHIPGTFFTIGTTPVTYHFRDTTGQTETCVFDVIVTFEQINPCQERPCRPGTCMRSNNQDMFVCQCPPQYYFADRTCQYDNIPPEIRCPTDLEGSTSGSVAIVDWEEPTATDNSGLTPTQTYQSHHPGYLFAIGRTVVVYTFQDTAGNMATCTFGVTVSAAIITPVDPCDSISCQNGAMCYRSNSGDFFCDCPHGFSGTLCEVRSPCQPNPCHNSGTCHPSSTGYTCTCSTSWSGYICNVPLPCQPNPCQNGGTCTQLDALAYSCSCLTGWVGEHCEGKINPAWEPWTTWTDCSVSCGNGFQQRTRTCLDFHLDDSATCFGQSLEFTTCNVHVTCEEPSPCQSDPCQNGGTCVPSGYALYNCYCTPGWTGLLCETFINPEWSLWTDWTQCSVSCESGIQNRFRTCNDANPSDGIRCLGQTTELQTCTEMTCPTGYPIKPEWSTWSSWSQCSVTCNVGSRQRSRMCQDDYPNDGLICAGQAVETQTCATWDCPDCSKQCPFGTLNTESCDVCECTGHLLTGRVLDMNNRPLSDASVAYNYRPNTTLATTTSDGGFRVYGVCAVVQTMVVTKDKYSTSVVDTQVGSAASSSLQATLHRLELPVVTEHPRNKTRLSGESVSFCCSAESDPPPSTYEWYQDGDILSTTGTTLTLHQLSTDDSGSYKCRAVSNAGNVFSDLAILTVTDAHVLCNSQPSGKMIALPSDCVQSATGLAAYDVGTCGNTVCTGAKMQQTLCKDQVEEEYCCQAVQTETVNVVCQGYVLPVSKILACGCGACVISPTHVSGIVVSAETGEELDFIFVYYLDESEAIAATDEMGRFSFEIPQQVNRISLSFSDVFEQRVSDTTVVIDIQAHSITYKIVKMKPRPPEVTIQPTQESYLPVVGNDTNPLAEVVIPANSIYDTNGDLYTGNTKARVNAIDMRNSTEAELAPGDFTTVNQNGDRETLKSFGMFKIDITDDSGNPLSVGGKVNLTVDASKVPGCDTPDGVCSTKIWVLNRKTGSWEELGPLVVSEGGSRRKRQNEQIIIGGMEFEFESSQFYNIDDIAEADRCWAKVIGYQTSELRQILPNFIGTFQVTAIMKDIQEAFYQRIGNGALATTRYGEGVCVAIPCDSGSGGMRYTVHLSATYQGKDLLPGDDTSSRFALTDADINSLGYKIKGKFNIEMNPRQSDQTQGPIFPGKNAGDRTGTCSTATSMLKHFQFHSELPDVFCHNFIEIGQLMNNYHLNFYPQKNHIIPSQKQNYCFIGITIQTSSDQMVTVVSTSTVGETQGYTIPDGEPQYYGRRQINAEKTNPTDSFIKACIEFKCRGTVYNSISDKDQWKTDNTKVTIDIQGSSQRCCIKSLQTVFKEDNPHIQPNQVLPIYFIDKGNRGPDSGVKDYTNIGASSDCGDQQSPQDTTINHCEHIRDGYRHAIEVVCDSTLCAP